MTLPGMADRLARGHDIGASVCLSACACLGACSGLNLLDINQTLTASRKLKSIHGQSAPLRRWKPTF